MDYARVDGGQVLGSVPSLPITLEQRVSIASFVTTSLSIALAAGVLLTPFGLVAGLAALDPSAFLTIAQHPATAIQLGLALAIGIGFVAVPMKRLVRRARAPRRIVVCDQTVVATDRWLADGGGWSEPLAAYKGVAHHVRTTLSGAHHEIVLIHEEASKSVVLHMADRIAQPQVDAVAALLNVAEIPARAMYERERVTLPAAKLKAA